MTPYDKNNIFAKMIRREIEADIIYEDDVVFAFPDIMPAAPVHILIVPKGEYVSFDDFIQQAPKSFVYRFYRAIQIIAKEQNIDESGYRLIMNHGSDASQAVFHFHVHLLGGEALGGLLAQDRHIR
jgi:histidine triad (HIT) family protein